MHIKPLNEYIKPLADLWHQAFHDEEEYIALFFSSAYKRSNIFAAFEEKKIVSVLYLLDCSIKLSGKVYDGYYLYAAATDEAFRAKGHMGSLIREARIFAEKNGKAFICLVPGNADLYKYYSKFGFVRSMYKCFSEFYTDNDSVSEIVSADVKSYFEKRELLSENCFIWKIEELRYVFDCLLYSGEKPLMLKNGSAIIDKKERAVSELITAKDSYDSSVREVLDHFSKGKVRIYSPYGKEKIPFGMIYAVNDVFDVNSEIYMNLALD